MKFLNHNTTKKGGSMHKRFLFVAFMFAFLVSAIAGIPKPISEIEFKVQSENITITDEDKVINKIDIPVTFYKELEENEPINDNLQLTTVIDKDNQVVGIDVLRVEHKHNYKEWARSLPIEFVEHRKAPPRI